MFRKLFRRINIYHILYAIITLGFLACSVFVFRDAFKLFITSSIDIGTSSLLENFINVSCKKYIS